MLHNIHTARKPCVVPSKDIECIRKMIDNEMAVSIENDFVEGDIVRIVDGPLIGYEGVLIEKKGKARFGIQLKEINQMVFIDICCSILERK